MKTILCFITILLALHHVALAQEDTIENALLRDVPAWMAENHVPCVGVGLIEHDKIKWVKTFGAVRTGVPAPANTLFNIASQTKPVTAMLTLKLVQAGLWNLDEPLAHYWIDPDIATDPYLNKLTTRLVLSHQSGFPNWRTDNGGTTLHFNFEPGTKFSYSGEGFEYLRRALENKFHQPLDVLLKTYLLGAAGMKDTYYWYEGLDTGRFAMWHNGEGKRYDVSIQTPVNAADDLITTVEDYCKFGIYTMDGLGLSDTLFADMTSPQVNVKENYYRCLGWGLVTGLPGGEYALEHGGSDIGVRTMAIFLPKSKSGIVVMTNGDNGLFVIDQIIKRALPYGSQIQVIMNRGSATHQRIPLSAAIIKIYEGLYRQSNGKVMKVEAKDNAIKVSGDGVPTAELFPESTTKFFLEGYDVQMEFTGDGSLIIYEGGKQVGKLTRNSGTAQNSNALRQDMYGIASDATEGRFTGSPGYVTAARYISSQLAAAGVKAACKERGKMTYFQSVPFIWDDYNRSSLVIQGHLFHPSAGNFIILSQGPFKKGKWIVEAPGDTVKGHPAGIVLLPDANQAKDWETTVIRQYRFGYMHYVPDGGPGKDSIARIMISPALAANLHAGDSLRVIIHCLRLHKTGYNVVGVLPGTDRTSIVVSAHLDHIGRLGKHIYNGANDDASGCVAELEAARRLSGYPRKHTIFFAFFCGEELNLKGSRWFNDHLPDGAGRVALNINLEQVGSKHRSVKGVWALGDSSLKVSFYTSGRDFPIDDLSFSPTDSVRDILSNTDGFSFMNKNIPSLLLGSGGFPEHHSPEDKIDLIDFDHLLEVTGLLASLIQSFNPQ